MKYSSKLGIGAAQQPTQVRVEPAASGQLTEIVSAPGEIQRRTKVSISAMVAAPIVAIPFDEGASVTKGKKPDGSDASILVQLDDKNYRAALHSAEARRDSQQAQIEVAKERLLSSDSQIQAQRYMLE